MNDNKLRDELAEEYWSEQCEHGELNSRHMDDLSGAFCAGYDARQAEIDKLRADLEITISGLENSCYCDDGWYRSTDPCCSCETLNKIKGV